MFICRKTGETHGVPSLCASSFRLQHEFSDGTAMIASLGKRSFQHAEIAVVTGLPSQR